MTEPVRPCWRRVERTGPHALHVVAEGSSSSLHGPLTRSPPASAFESISPGALDEGAPSPTPRATLTDTEAPSVLWMSVPRMAIGPQPTDFAAEAVVAGGGEVVGIDEAPDGLVWLHGSDAEGLASSLARAPEVQWVQLPMAGIEAFADVGLLDPDLRWTCAKGAFAEPVAEHALTLALAGLRHLPTRLAAHTWGTPSGTSLYDQEVTILGGGGITAALLDLLEPFPRAGHRRAATPRFDGGSPSDGRRRRSLRSTSGSTGGFPCPCSHPCEPSGSSGETSWR